MRDTIHKFPLANPGGVSAVWMPDNANIIKAADQEGVLCLWAEVDSSDAALGVRLFHVVGTGQRLPNGNIQYIDTVVVPPYVWHIYEFLGKGVA